MIQIATIATKATTLLSINQVFFVTRGSYYYLLPDSDILENMVDLIHKEGRGTYIGFFRCSTHQGPITVMTEV